MSFRYLLVFFLCVLIFTPSALTYANVTVEPLGLAVSLGENETQEEEIVLINNSENDVAFRIKYEMPPRQQMQFGPRRDEVTDLRLAIYADTPGWWDDDRDWLNRPAQLDIEFDLFRSEQIPDFDPREYNMVIFDQNQGRDNQPFYQRYNDNLEMFEEWTEMGGILVWWTGTNQPNPVPRLPLGLLRNQDGNNGSNLLNPDIDLNEETHLEYPILTPFGQYNDDTGLRRRITGGSCNHGSFARGDLPEESFVYYFVEGQENRVTVVTYPFGRGMVYASTLTSTLYWDNGAGTNNGFEPHNIFHWADFVRKPTWVVIEPMEGVIEANNELVLNAAFNTENMDRGVHELYIAIEFADNTFPTIRLSAIMSVTSPVVNVSGIVTDAATDEPIPGVELSIHNHYFKRWTNEDGEFFADNIPLGEYVVTISMLDYLPITTDVAFDEVGDEFIPIEMLHSQCNLSINNVQRTLPPDASEDVHFQISNNGNGPLTYRSERELLGDANAEPWEYRRGYPISEITEDDRLQGVVFANDRFYVAGSAARQKKMYVVSREGELLDTYDQFSASTYGYCDLAWDGELIWGTGERRVYGFTPEGELVIDWDGPFATNNNLAWDSDRESLWVNGNTTNIVLMSRDGNRGRELNRRGLRVYGLSYWPEDPDGYNLYIFHNPTGEVQAVTKMHPVSGDTLPVVVTEPDGAGRPAASFITNEFDVYSWVFMTISNPGAVDRIDIWQLDARKDWMAVDPTEGVIEAGESEDFVLTLDATGLPTVRFEGQIVFYHDGVSGRTVLPITLDVAEGRVEVVRRYDFTDGWNMISFNVEPELEDVVELFRPIVENDQLVMLKDGRGRFYRPEFGFNNIPRWVVSEGYQARFAGEASLDVRGVTVLADDPIQLVGGWQIISYFPRQQVDAVVGFANIVDNLEIAKDVAGRFYLPAWGFSNMQPLREGQGYQLKMTEPDELVINFQQVASNLNWDYQAIQPKRSVEPTGENMSVLVLSDNLSGEIGVYAGDRLVGSGVLSNGAVGIAVWGDANLTGQTLRILRFVSDETQALQVENLSGEGLYYTDGLWVVRISEGAVPAEWGLAGVYPNPFNMTSRALFRMPESGRVSAVLFDVSGRQVLEVFNGKLSAGEHHLAIDGATLSAGVYVLRVNAAGRSWQQKIAVVK